MRGQVYADKAQQFHSGRLTPKLGAVRALEHRSLEACLIPPSVTVCSCRENWPNAEAKAAGLSASSLP